MRPKPYKKKRKISYLNFLRKAWRLYYEEAKKRSDEAIEALEQHYKKELAKEKERENLEEQIHSVFFQPPMALLYRVNAVMPAQGDGQTGIQPQHSLVSHSYYF